jgi:gliding motility-associated-like protein
MINKILFLRFLIWVILIFFPRIGYSQFCPNAVVPPITINGINVTATSTGSVSTYPYSYTSCGVYTTPANSIYLGQPGTFTYSMNFSSPVNNLDFIITGAGYPPGEVFTFNTNTGIPSIIDQGSCFSTITGNVLSSGVGITSGNGGYYGGGGYFTLVNATPFTSVTISGPGGQAGSLFAICASSIGVAADTTIEICNGDSVLIGGTYQKVSGLYSDGIITTNLIVNSISVDLGRDTTLCAGKTLMLDAPTSSATYLWQDNSTNPTFNVSQQGTYWAEVTLNNCTDSDTVIINYNLLANVDLGSDTTLCLGETLMLNATIPNVTYLWQDNSTNPTFNVSQQGTYWAEVTLNNCTDSDTVIISYNLLVNVDLGNDTTLCLGEILMLNATIPNATYLWQDNSTNSIFNVSQQGTHWAEVTLNNCTDVDTVIINYNLLLLANVDLGNDTTLCLGEILMLDATTPNVTYLWQDNSTNPTLHVTQQGTYWVQITNSCGSTSDSILINEEVCEIILEVPNLFTPNNDGVNDLFVPIISKGMVSMNTIIFNRWGSKVFETKNLMIEWNGQDVSDGTYFWIVYYTDVVGVKDILRGYVTIFK